MEKNTDWRVPVALILAGLALFVAINGRNASPFMGGNGSPAIVISGGESSQPRIVVGSGDSGSSVAVAPPPAPNTYYAPERQFGFGHRLPIFAIFPFIGLALLLFFVFRFSGRRDSWQRHAHGPSGGGQWQSQQPVQGPQGQRQQGQNNPQPAQSPQPGQGPGHWEWHADPHAPRTEPNPGDNQSDIIQPGQGRQG